MIKSEWIKLWSVRSTWFALYVAAAGTIGLAATYALVADVGTVGNVGNEIGRAHV